MQGNLFDELETANEEWQGMPEFVQDDLSPHRVIYVRFRNDEDVAKFEVNQSLLQSQKIDEPALENKQPQWRLLRSNRTLCLQTGEVIKLTSKEFDLIERLAEYVR